MDLPTAIITWVAKYTCPNTKCDTDYITEDIVYGQVPDKTPWKCRMCGQEAQLIATDIDTSQDTSVMILGGVSTSRTN